MKIFDAYIIEVGEGNIDEFEHIAIKAETKDKAWERALYIAFSDLFSTRKMVVVEENITSHKGI